MPEEIAPPLREGRYRLIDEIGMGGMATVYSAFDMRLKRLRAIKILDPKLSQNDSLRVRFEEEAATMARLDHANIVRVYDTGSDGDRCYIVMEYEHGGSLSDCVGRRGIIPSRQATELMLGMLAGLGHAHREGVIHRDVKPHNLMIAKDGTPRLTDFGIAQVSEENRSVTRTDAVLGTWAYMAPEQRLSARNAGVAADLYSTAASLYAVTTGLEPFDLYTTELYSRLYKTVPEPLALVIQRACKYDPEDRYASANDLADALREVFLDLPELPDGTLPLAPDPEDIARETPNYKPEDFGTYQPSAAATPRPTPSSTEDDAKTFYDDLAIEGEKEEEEAKAPPSTPVRTFHGDVSRNPHFRSLSQLYMFRSVPPSALAELWQLGKFTAIKEGQVVLKQGDEANAALLLLQGELEAVVGSGPKEKAVGRIRAGELVGETAIFAKGGKRSANVRAVKPSNCLLIGPRVMSASLDNPALVFLEIHMLATMAKRIRGTNQTIQGIWEEAAPTPVRTPTAKRSGGFRDRMRALFGGDK